jgi:hypothetical protein
MATNNSYSNVGCKEAKPRSAFMHKVTWQTVVNIKWHICISHALAYSKYLNKYAFTANVKYVNITTGNWRCSSKEKARRLRENLFECLFPLNKRRPFCMQYIKKTVTQIGAGYSNYFFIYYMWTGKLLSRINKQAAKKGSSDIACLHAFSHTKHPWMPIVYVCATYLHEIYIFLAGGVNMRNTTILRKL